MTPWFSLILPCYNVEQYVERCVQSILSQEFSDYEIILVDDGSTDQTPIICDALAEKHSCIRVLHQENGDPSSARNAGLNVAQGRYVWFIDSDDWIEAGALRSLYEASAETNPDVLKFDYSRIEDVSHRVICEVESGLHTGGELEKLRRMGYCAQRGYGMSGCMHVYRREMLEEHHIRFVSERKIGSEDVLFTIQVLFHAQSLYMLHQPFYNYERRNGSLSQSYMPDLVQRYTAFREWLMAFYRSNCVLQRYERLVNRFYLWHLIMGTCVRQEYTIVPKWQTMRDARKQVRKLLSLNAVQDAVTHADQTGFTWRKKIQMLAIRLRMEPLFYWLYVVRPSRKSERRRKEKK